MSSDLPTFRGVTTVYQAANTLMKQLGLDPEALYQMFPDMSPKTVQRIKNTFGYQPAAPYTPAEHLAEDHSSVHMYLYGSKEQKAQVHLDTSAEGFPDLPDSLPGYLHAVRAAALKAGVSLRLALKACLVYRNPCEVVERRLRDIAQLSQQLVYHNVNGFFVRLMRENREVTLREEAAPKKPEWLPEAPAPLQVGDTVWMYGEACRVIQLGSARSTVLKPDGEEFDDGNPRLLTCRALWHSRSPGNI